MSAETVSELQEMGCLLACRHLLVWCHEKGLHNSSTPRLEIRTINLTGTLTVEVQRPGGEASVCDIVRLAVKKTQLIRERARLSALALFKCHCILGTTRILYFF